MDRIIFFVLATLAITAALGVVSLRRAVYGALCLIVCFGALAGLFFQLGAQFLAAIQVIVYAGAIMVLFLFAIMLLDPESEIFPPNRLRTLSLAALILGSVMAFLLLASVLRVQGHWESAFNGSVETIGDALFQQYLLPFEVTSILILVAILGAVVLTKRPSQ